MRLSDPTVSRFLLVPLLVTTFVVTLVAAPQTRAAECATPWQIAQEITAVIETGSPLDQCDWKARLDPWDAGIPGWKFHCWEVGCWQNLPVLAAAVAVMEDPDPYGHDYRQWFHVFLKAQLGKPVPEQTVTENATYFKGTEMLSPIYDGWTTAAVMAVYYWSVHMEPNAPHAAGIRDLADDYLRATFYLWGLTTGKSDVAVQYLNDAYYAGASTKERYPVAAASPRARAELTNSRSWFFAKASGLSGNPQNWKPAALGDLVEALESRWSMVYGLNGTMRGYLQNLVQHHQLPGNLNAVLDGLRMIRDMHFVIWNGDRLSFLEGATPNTNKGTVFAQGYYFHPFRNTSGAVTGKEVHYLYPYNPRSTGAPGSLTIEAAFSRLKASSHEKPTPVYLYVPTARPIQHHLRLGPAGLTYCPATLSCP